MAFYFGAQGPGTTEVISGSSENDIIDHLGGSDIIFAGPGFDTLVFYDIPSNFTVVTLAGITRIYGASTADPKYMDQVVVTVDLEQLKFINQEVVAVSVSDNIVILGTTGSEFNDSIDHGGGSVLVDGKAGTDTLVFFDNIANFSVSTLAGITKIVGEPSALPEYAGFEVTIINVEQVRFLDGVINLGGSNVPITGTDGDDVLIGGFGNDVIDPAGGADFIDGGDGLDTVLINDRINNFQFWTLQGITALYGEDSDATNEVYRENITILDSVEIVQFLDGSKTLPTTNGNVVYGSSTDGELIVGSPGDDIIFNLGGDDRIDGGAGNDVALFFDNFDNFIVTKHVTSLGTRFRVFGKDVDNVNWDAYEGKLSILDNVETLQFLDRIVTLSDDLNQLNPDVFGTKDSASSSEDVVGAQGNNFIDHLGGSDRIDGGGGTDTLIFWDVRENFEVITLQGITHVLGSAEAKSPYINTDSRLINVENLLFLDHTETIPTNIPTNKNLIFGKASGNGSSEVLTATAGDDLIDHMGGSDNINGGGGNDTLLFFDSIANFTVVKLAGIIHVLGGSEARPYYRDTDTTIQNIERLQFIDGFIDTAITAGTPGNDSIPNSLLSETFDGGAGVDTLNYAGNRSSYTVLGSVIGGSYTVKSGTETDLLISIERISFADKDIAIDLANGQAAANTARLLGAAFGAVSIYNKQAVGVGLSYFDSGMTIDQVADMIVDLNGFKQMSDRTFASTLCNNTGYPASTHILNMLEQLLHSGIDRGDMLRAAAELDVNAQSIGLIGLRLGGIEFIPYEG